jgi:hypothetical protein
MAQGRQAANYQKYGFQIKWLKLDFYLIVIPKQTYIPRHTDPAPKNYVHNRCNLTISGKGALTLYDEQVSLSQRFVKFQPSEVTHSFFAQTNCYILSLGWLTHA